MAACPICKGAVTPYPENPSTPFCSKRCKLIDLGKWVDGDYRIGDDAPAVPVPGPRGNGSQA